MELEFGLIVAVVDLRGATDFPQCILGTGLEKGRCGLRFTGPNSLSVSLSLHLASFYLPAYAPPLDPPAPRGRGLDTIKNTRVYYFVYCLISHGSSSSNVHVSTCSFDEGAVCFGGAGSFLLFLAKQSMVISASFCCAAVP